MMMDRRRYLIVVILIAITFLFLNIIWDCSDYSVEASSYDNGQGLEEFLDTEECYTDAISQELINLSSIQIPKNISSYFSFKHNQPYIQIAKLQLEENLTVGLPFIWLKNKIPQAQTYILNSSYLL